MFITSNIALLPLSEYKIKFKNKVQEDKMKIPVLLLVAITGFSACSLVPYPTSGDKNQITVYQPYVGKFDHKRAMQTAEAHCKKYGKKARLQADQGNKIVFECD
jgi:hypothetical protein